MAGATLPMWRPSGLNGRNCWTAVPDSGHRATLMPTAGAVQVVTNRFLPALSASASPCMLCAILRMSVLACPLICSQPPIDFGGFTSSKWKRAADFYGATYEAQEDEWVATIPIGYADGWFRHYKRHSCSVEGHACPVLGAGQYGPTDDSFAASSASGEPPLP